MPYDPNLPQENTPADAAQMRAQFNGLKDLIDAVPGIASAVVDTVNTVAAGQPAAVSMNIAGGVLHVSFDIPQGNDGTNGADGAPGAPGRTARPEPPGRREPRACPLPLPWWMR
jgi:hypothetical protein